MKRRNDELVVNVKQEQSGGPSAVQLGPSSTGVFSSGVRGVPSAGASGTAPSSHGAHTLVLSRQSLSPAQQLQHLQSHQSQPPPSSAGAAPPCLITTNSIPGPTIVQTFRSSSPAVKSEGSVSVVTGTMPGSLTYPAQSYPAPNMAANNPNPTIKGTSGGLQGGSPVVVSGGASSSSSHSLHSLQQAQGQSLHHTPQPHSLNAAPPPMGSGSSMSAARHKVSRPGGGSGSAVSRVQHQQHRGGAPRSGSNDAPPPPPQVHSSSTSVSSTSGSGGSNLTASQQSQQQQQQFQRLKVEDALSYLDQVKFKFGNQPQVYNDFLDIMKEFKSQSIDTPGVIARVSNLFKGHPELIVGFNTFLPPGYKIEVQANDQGFAFQVSVSMPSPTSTTSMGPVTHHHTLPISTSSGSPAVNAPPSASSAAPPTVSVSVTASSSSSSSLNQSVPSSGSTVAPPVPSKPVTLPSGPIGIATVHHAAPSLHGYSSSVQPSSSPHHPPSSSQPPSIAMPSSGGGGGGSSSSLLGHQSGHTGAAQILAESMQPTPQSQPVDFSHAINYVNKIKNRFQGQPDKYKSFLDILHAYQKEQRSLKEGLATPGKHLTEAEVYSQVAKLFENQEDLVQEFGQFLPDATSHQAALPSLFLAQMGAVLQSNKGLSNDHTSAKKPLGLKPGFNNASAGLAALSMGAMGNNSKFGQQVKRSPSFSASSQPPAKKPKMASLRDVSLAEAGKYGSLNDYGFFDKVRKALKSQEVYENFLRCLVLFNQEVISSAELVQLATPFLGRFPELLRWFKEFLGHNDSSATTSSGGTSAYQSLHSSALDNSGSGNVGRQDRSAGDLAMEIDYSTCKRLGASYCALPKTYMQPKCSGRTLLCKEVLNDTWVSFPTWSEDSTFVTSRKTQYEEYIYRCEDERFELDVVLETNAATIRVLEGVFKKMSRMQSEELAKFHLDDNLGGTSNTIHQRALRRIYGDKAPDIIMGLKKNPSAAVPVVLRRLKAKEEEWREAQKGFNKVWREQNEKYYLKSLDHQGINFKQNDVKALRSKSLFNEIETLYDERHEQAEEGSNEIASGPHLVLPYRDKSVLDDAANLLIHHVKRQTGIHKDDKQTIKQMLRHFIPDLFFHPRQELSDDEREDEANDDKEDGEGSTQSAKGPKNKTESDTKKESTETSNTEIKPESTPSTSNKPSSQCSNSSDKESAALPPHAISSHPDEHYAMFMTSNTWYLFLRLHQILCERLTRMYERAMALAAEEAQNKLDRKESTAVALRLKPKSEIEVEDYYPAFLDMVKNVLDGNMESNAYEDTLREMFGIHAYIAFTLDKVVIYAVRQLQQLVIDETSQECLDMFQDEQRKGGAGGACSLAALNIGAELSYQRRAEQAMADENCYKIYIYKKDCRITIELLDSEVEEPENATEAEKGASYLEKYVSGLDTLSEDVKERLARKPVFLPRNVRHYQKRGKQGTGPDLQRSSSNNSGQNSPEHKECSSDPTESKSRDTDDKREKAGSAIDEEKGKDKRPSDSPPSLAESVDSTECRFNLSSYTRVYVVDKESIMYKREALLKAKESHPAVSRRLSRQFRAWHHTWADEHVSEEQQKQSSDWLMGRGENVVPNRTRILTNNDLNRPPYCPYNRYRVDRLSEAGASSSSSTASSS